MKKKLTRIFLKACDLTLFAFVVLLAEFGIGEHVLEVWIIDLEQGWKRFVNRGSQLTLVADGRVLIV